jgi:dienelactone hydrolase
MDYLSSSFTRGFNLKLLARWMHRREIRHWKRDDNRIVRPFDWGLSFIKENAKGNDPRAVLNEHSKMILSDSDSFYALPGPADYKFDGFNLTWSSSVETPSEENNTVRAKFFPTEKKRKRKRAVLILPHWNAQPESYFSLARLFNRIGLSALRLTLPYHETRRPPELERADHLVSSNIGRTLQSMRQAVLDTRAAARWLKEEGFERVGLIGTSIGSCTGFLAMAHDEQIDVGVFNHVSGYFADVVWKGISTKHVRDGFGDELTLEELREFWLPISPMPFIPRMLKLRQRPMRFIYALYDLTFPVDLSREVIKEARRQGVEVDVAAVPCGHYSLGEKPWVYWDAWKIASFFLKRL